MRPEIEMMVQVNGTPMHYGRLMVSVGYVSRYYGDEAEGDAALTSMSNVNWLQISANSVRNASINVPWMAPVERFPVVCPLERASGGVERYGPRRTFSLHPEGIYF